MDAVHQASFSSMSEEDVSVELFESLNCWCEEQLPHLDEEQLCRIARAIDIQSARVKDKSKFRILKEIGTTVDKKREESLWMAFLLLKIIKKEVVDMQRGEDTNSDDKDKDALSPESDPKVCEDDTVKEEEKQLKVNSQKKFGIAGSRRTGMAPRMKSDQSDEKEWWNKFYKGDHKEQLRCY